MSERQHCRHCSDLNRGSDEIHPDLKCPGLPSPYEHDHALSSHCTKPGHFRSPVTHGCEMCAAQIAAVVEAAKDIQSWDMCHWPKYVRLRDALAALAKVT